MVNGESGKINTGKVAFFGLALNLRLFLIFIALSYLIAIKFDLITVKYRRQRHDPLDRNVFKRHKMSNSQEVMMAEFGTVFEIAIQQVKNKTP